MPEPVKKRILLVEDQTIVAMTEKMQLEKYGYSVHHVTTGEKAVQTITDNTHPVDLILMDINLGSGIDGTEAAEIILKDHDIPIVFLSSHTEPEIVEKTEKITSYGYVVKDSSVTVLDASIKMAFRLFDAKSRIAQSEEKHRTLFETMSPGVVYLDAHGSIISANPASEKLLGLSFDQMNGKTPMDPRWKMITEDGEEIPGPEHPVMAALKTGEKVGPVIRGVFVPETEEYVWLLIAAIPLFRPGEDTPYQVHATFEDISEQKRADDALKRSREKIASIFKAAPTGIGVVQGRKKRTIVEANERLCLMTGYSCDELIGKPARILYPSQEDFDYVGAEKYRQIDARGGGTVETRWKKKDGTVIEVLLASSPIHPTDISLGVTFTAMDITERKQAEAAVREQRNFAESLIETAQIIILVLDMDGNIVRFNPYTEELLGYSLDEVKGMNWIETFVQAEDSHIVKTVLLKTTADNQTHRNVNSVTGKDGQKILVEWSNNTLTDAGGHATGILATGVDITERTQAETKLAESVTRYDELVALVPVGIYIAWVEANGHIEFQYVSDRWCEIHGLRREDVMNDAATVTDLVHPDDRESFVKLNRDAANAAKPFEWEGRIITGDGDQRQLRIESTPVVSANGDIQWFGVTQDITDRKRAEEKYRSLFNYSNDAIFVRELGDDNLPGRIIEVNEQACRLSQYSREELLQMPMSDIASEKTRSLMPSRVRKLVEEKHLTFEAEDVRRDGSLIPVEVSAFSYSEGGEDFVVSSVRDITERKMAEEEIRKAKDDLQTISDNMLDLVSVTDMDGNFKFAGSSHTILGYEIEYLIGKNVMDFVHPDDLPELQAKFVDFLSSKKTTADAVYRNRCADGSYLWFETFATLIFDNDGNQKEILFNTRDITDRKQAEEKIQKQLAEKETLLREGHHRMKNNMATIESLLSLQIGDSDSPDVKAALQEAISRVQSIRVLYEKLLISEDRVEISIRDYAESLIDSLVMFFDPEKNITVKTHVADIDVASKKAVSIGIIINELVTNVFKYAFRDRDNGKVSLTITKEENEMTLIIHDNGVGIDERIMENESPGFGLTIVKMLTEQLEGTITFKNDNGTRVTLEFPITE
ncbi:MAG: PAS domain S-box protein [Spirochaeta sp.]|jgi:PAS domain S-box-containing protein|nr:PAS domain S-box protein [Spirochaeta sp.]